MPGTPRPPSPAQRRGLAVKPRDPKKDPRAGDRFRARGQTFRVRAHSPLTLVDDEGFPLQPDAQAWARLMTNAELLPTEQS